MEQLASLGTRGAAEAENIIRTTGERIRRLHGLKRSPLVFNGTEVTAEGVAGVVSLRQGIDLEIKPKYAHPDGNWKEDMLFLSLFTTYGHLDAVRSVGAAVGTPNSLADMAARALLALIDRNQRAPLRLRSRTVFEAFEFDGDIDPEDLLNPGEDGWRQIAYVMNVDNEFASTIIAGAQALMPHLRSVEVRSRLMAAMEPLGRPSASPSVRRRILPPRLTRWQPAYDLAFELARDRSLTPMPGRLSTFGFTIDTWRTWESLIERSLIIGIGAARVRLQAAHPLGFSTRSGGPPSPIEVRPDALVAADAGPLIVDAKYKGRADRFFAGISAADRYEAIAFMHATGAKDVILIYPHVGRVCACGTIEHLETATIPTGLVHAVSIEVNGIAKTNGFSSFVAGVRAVVEGTRTPVLAASLQSSSTY